MTMARMEEIEAVTLAAYRAGLEELSGVGESADALLDRLGDVNAQVSDPTIEVRFGLAGRLIAAGQLAAFEPWTETEIRQMIRGLLDHQRAQRDDAAPADELRSGPEENVIDNLDSLLVEETLSDGLEMACSLAASMILQWMVPAEMDLERSLAIQGQLADLAEAAGTLLSEAPPRGTRGMYFEELLGMLDVRARHGRPAVVSWVSQDSPEARWLMIAAAGASAHAGWSGHRVEDSMIRSVARATERLASGCVPDEPQRFSMAGALEHVREVALDAALARLAEVMHPEDSETGSDALDGLLEASSTGLIGAWVSRRLPG
jgi:hypothetical protein